MGSQRRGFGIGRVVTAIASVAILATCAALPSIAEAREVDYRGAPGCPSARDVSRAIEERAPEGRDARITIEKTAASGYRGELVLGDGNAKLTRSVAARSCAAVVDALALVVALDEGGEAAGAVETDARDAKADAKADASPSSSPSPNAVTVAYAGDPDAVVDAPPSRRDWSVGAAASGMSFNGDHTLAGIALFGDLRRDRPLFDLGFMQASVRVSLGRTFQTDIGSVNHDVTSHFQLTYGSIEACPLGSSIWHDRVTSSICARADLGALDANTGNGNTETRLWSAVGGMTRMRFAVTRPGTWRPVLDVSTGLLTPMVRDRFHVLDDPAIRAATLLYTGSVGVGVVFP